MKRSTTIHEIHPSRFTLPLRRCVLLAATRAVERNVDKNSIFNISFRKLSYICSPKRSNTNDMKNYVTISLSVRGGGYAPVRADVVECRVKLFYRRKSTRPISEISIDDRRIAVFVMINSFGFSTASLAEFFKASQRTIQRDYDHESFYQSRNKVHQAAATALRDYIIYNAKYCR